MLLNRFRSYSVLCPQGFGDLDEDVEDVLFPGSSEDAAPDPAKPGGRAGPIDDMMISFFSYFFFLGFRNDLLR